MANMFKTHRNIKDTAELTEILKGKLGEKYTVTLKKADTGAKKLLTGHTYDMINVKKNAYHGIALTISDRIGEEDGYSVVSLYSYTPNAVVNQILGKTGTIDLIIARLIWGNGVQFQNDIEGFVKTDLEGKEVDSSLTNSVKQMFKGKSIFEEEK